MGWKFWLAVAIIVVGPLVCAIVWNDGSFVEAIANMTMCIMACVPGIFIGFRRFQREIRCSPSSEISIKRRLVSACSAWIKGVFFGLLSGIIAVLSVLNLIPFNDTGMYVAICMPPFFAAITSVIAFIFGCGIGQPLKQS